MSGKEPAEVLTEVTDDQFNAIRADLEKLLKISQKEGETLEAYARRLAKRASDGSVVSDDDWETLEEQTQQWVNAITEADEKGTALILPPQAVAESGEQEPQTTAAGGENEKKGMAKKTAKKANGAATKATKSASAGGSKKTAKAPAKSKEKAGAVRRGRKPKHGEDAVIKLKVQENPHRKGSNDFDKFKKLKNYDGKPLGKALAAGIEAAYIRYLEKRELLTVKG